MNRKRSLDPGHVGRAWAWIAYVGLGSLLASGLSACKFEAPRAVIADLVPSDQVLSNDVLVPEPVHRAGLIPSDVFWLAARDRVLARWGEFFLEFTEVGAPPRCGLCAGGGRSPAGLSLLCTDAQGVVRTVHLAGLPIVNVLEQPRSSPGALIESISFDYLIGCLGFAEFSPPVDAQLELLATVAVRPRAPLHGRPGMATLGVRIVPEGGRIMEPRRLNALLSPDPADPPRWRLLTPNRGPRWEENFSDSLRVTRVRAVRMSSERVVTVPFVSVAVSNGPTCYASSDGTADLAACRLTTDPNDPGTPVDATPAYLGSLKEVPATWTVTLAASPPLDEGEELALEFTLEAKP